MKLTDIVFVRARVGVIGIMFAVITGMLSGIYPSRKASKLAPVGASRYE